MWNIMLDEKPEQWRGYPIKADFRIGIQIIQTFNDPELSKPEKISVACGLLFPGIMPQDAEELQEAFSWFLNGWYLDGQSGKHEKAKAFDFDVDQWRIYSAFRAQYGIDLNTAELHYWEFMGMLANLEECSFTRVKELRVMKIKPKMDKEHKAAIVEAKKIYALEQMEEQISAEEKERWDEAVAAFMKLRRGNL